MIEVNSKNFKEVVFDTEGWKVVQFSSPGCMVCRMNEQILKEKEKELGVTFVKVNGMDNPDLLVAFDVKKAPTVFLVGNDRVFIMKDGWQGKTLIEAIIDIKSVNEV